MLSCDIRKVMAAALVLTTTFITMPISAADFSSARPVIGSVNAVGSVDLRGIGISQDGTLFSGDSIRSHEKGSAKILLGTGSKIELSEKTDVTVNSDKDGVKIAMSTGTIGFTAKSTLRVDVAPFEVIASDNAAGNVAVMSSTTAGVRAINGKVTVKNLKTSESFVLLKGQEQLLGLNNGVHAKPLAEVASNVPQPIPAPGSAPQTPAGQTKSNPGLAMDTGAWLAVAGAAGLAAVSIWALVEAHNNNNDINSLQNTVTSLNSTIAANQAANAAAIKAVQQTANLSLAASQQAAALSQATALAVQAQLALQAAGNTSGAQQFATLQGQIAANQSAINALEAQIQANQGKAAAVAALTSQEESLRNQTNTLLTNLSNLLNTFKNTNGVPPAGNTPGQVPPPVTSASVPA